MQCSTRLSRPSRNSQFDFDCGRTADADENRSFFIIAFANYVEVESDSKTTFSSFLKARSEIWK